MMMIALLASGRSTMKGRGVIVAKIDRRKRASDCFVLRIRSLGTHPRLFSVSRRQALLPVFADPGASVHGLGGILPRPGVVASVYRASPTFQTHRQEAALHTWRHSLHRRLAASRRGYIIRPHCCDRQHGRQRERSIRSDAAAGAHALSLSVLVSSERVGGRRHVRRALGAL